MHIYNSFTFNLVIVQEREANIFGRGEYGTKLACPYRLWFKLGDAKTAALLYVIKQNFS